MDHLHSAHSVIGRVSPGSRCWLLYVALAEAKDQGEGDTIATNSRVTETGAGTADENAYTAPTMGSRKTGNTWTASAANSM